MSVSTFNLPVLSQSLPQADSIIQVVDVLGQLNAIAEQMFNKIRDKAETQKRIIDSITARINAASSKANQLKKGNKATVIISPSSYPKQSPTHYQNVFTPLPSKPDLCTLASTVKPTKLGPAEIRDGPSNLNVDLSFSTMDSKPRKLSEPKYVPNAVNSIDELVPFCIEKPKNKKPKRKADIAKRKADIDPFVWDDLMSSVSRDSKIRYIPGYQNLPEAKNIPEQLMPDTAAINITFDKNKEGNIAPSYFFDLPDVGVPPEPVPSQTDKPVVPQPSEPRAAEPKMKTDEPSVPSLPLPTPPAPKQQKIDVEPSMPSLLPPPTPPAPKPAEPRIPMPPPPTLAQPVQEKRISPLPIPPPVSSAPPPPPPPPPQQMMVPQSRMWPEPEPRREHPEDFNTQLQKKIEERRKSMKDPKPEPQRRIPAAPKQESFQDQLKKIISERRESMIEDETEERKRKKQEDDEWSQ
jgi:hypothetical protein